VAHGEQLLDVELETDAEHQQDDADLGELFRERSVRDEAGRVGPHEDAGEQVADDGRQPEAVRDVAEHERGGESSSERQDEIVSMHVVALQCRVLRNADDNSQAPTPNLQTEAIRQVLLFGSWELDVGSCHPAFFSTFLG
jgi:hypothetical protein